MMMAFRYCVLIPLLAAAGLLVWPAQPVVRAQSPDSAQSHVQQLISDLGASSFQRRQNAEDELAAMGAAIRPALERALAQTHDTEVRIRLQTLLRDLKERDATGPSVITIHLKNATAAEAFSALWEQAGASLRSQPGNLLEKPELTRADVDLDAELFWPAIRQLCQTYGLQLQVSGTSDRDVLLVDKPTTTPLLGKAPWQAAGPFMVIAQTVNRNQWMDLNQGRNINRYCNVQLMVVAEPKLRVLQGTYTADIEKAVDDQGNSLLLPGIRQQSVQTTPGWVWSLQLSLKPTDHAGHKIARLQGTSQYWIQTESDRLELTDLSGIKDSTRQVGSRELIVRSISSAQSTSQVRISLSRAAWSPTELSFMQAGGSVRLLDGNGRALPRIGGTSTSINGNHIDLVYRFQEQYWGSNEHADAPARLVIEVPTQTRQMDVPFDFSDLPLP